MELERDGGGASSGRGFWGPGPARGGAAGPGPLDGGLGAAAADCSAAEGEERGAEEALAELGGHGSAGELEGEKKENGEGSEGDALEREGAVGGATHRSTVRSALRTQSWAWSSQRARSWQGEARMQSWAWATTRSSVGAGRALESALALGER